MRSYQVLRDAVERVGVKAVAAKLRVSTALVYKWCEENDVQDPDASGARNPLDRLRDVVLLTGDVSIVSWLCEQAGGFFARNPQVKIRNYDPELLESTQKLVQGFSQLLGDVSKSAADDGQISKGEAERIRADWERLKTAGESFVTACEQGNYRK